MRMSLRDSLNSAHERVAREDFIASNAQSATSAFIAMIHRCIEAKLSQLADSIEPFVTILLIASINLAVIPESMYKAL